MRGIYFKVTFPSLLFGTRVSSSLCRRADVDPQSEMDAVRGWPSGAACRSEKEQCPTSLQGGGGRGQGSNSCCTQRQTPEPTVKAQRVLGTNKLADMAARWSGPFSHWFKKIETKLEKTVGKALWLGGPATHHSQGMFSRKGPPLRNKHTQSFRYFSHNHFGKSESSFLQGSTELLDNFYLLIKPLGNIKVLRGTLVLRDNRFSFILWSECCRYTAFQEAMRKQFLGPIHSGLYFLLPLENQLAKY